MFNFSRLLQVLFLLICFAPFTAEGRTSDEEKGKSDQDPKSKYITDWKDANKPNSLSSLLWLDFELQSIFAKACKEFIFKFIENA